MRKMPILWFDSSESTAEIERHYIQFNSGRKGVLSKDVKHCNALREIIIAISSGRYSLWSDMKKEFLASSDI